MKYTVEVTPSALAELEAAYEWLQQRTPQHAPEWYNCAVEAVNSLEDMPARIGFARAGEELRELHFGKRQHAYRILFKVQDDIVRIYHFRHSARKR